MSLYILALDQGTTSSRAILFNERGELFASQAYEFKQHYPEPGWVEHDANEIWESQLRALRAVLKKAEISVGDLAAIGIANQRETTVVWDRASGEPIYRAIVWQSRQTVAICQDLVARGLTEVRRCPRSTRSCSSRARSPWRTST